MGVHRRKAGSYMVCGTDHKHIMQQEAAHFQDDLSLDRRAVFTRNTENIAPEEENEKKAGEWRAVYNRQKHTEKR